MVQTIILVRSVLLNSGSGSYLHTSVDVDSSDTETPHRDYDYDPSSIWGKFFLQVCFRFLQIFCCNKFEVLIS